ncbi:MAG: carbohydrate binding family 9 domain-containing protein [Bacteroidetes bacterium]|nr:carbohydrate binding family 9 domain-containing protein [Bacteroidota bacterium]
MQAVKVSVAPKIDGNLDDSVWDNVPVATDFVESFPAFGKKAIQKTEVKIIYDDQAVYVGAYLFDDPGLIRKQITARDEEQQNDADYFSVFFDTYLDHQNGFQFLVTSSNVQSDAKLGPNLATDFGEYGDKTWDAVWESKVGIQSDGWVVEMKIPYFSLRFSKKNVQDWGLQFLRSVRRSNETFTWNPVDPNVDGFVNQFGILGGLKNIEPPLRLSFSPYLSGGYNSTPVNNSYINQWLYSGGMDLKYGINESFTLDATLVPDFGQVVSDNVVNNLTPYEIKFQENRPFFTEGTELFNKAGLFYSRRIGATPEGYYDVQDSAASHPDLQLTKNPSLTQLYNAIKLSGRTEKKLGIGIFNAVTAPMHATLRNITTGKDSFVETEPLANYNILVLDQALKGRSYITFTNTNVLRSGNNRDANVSAIDIALFDKNNIHRLSATARYSKIWGLNPYDGYNTDVKFAKVSGRWQYELEQSIISEKYDPNDLGILFAPNNVAYKASVSYEQNTPTKNFLTYHYTLSSDLEYLYKPFVYSNLEIKSFTMWVFHNFWDVEINAFIDPLWNYDYFELRTPGKYLAYPQNFSMELEGSSDSRKKFFFNYGFNFSNAPKYDYRSFGIDLGVRYRFGNRLSLELQTSSDKEINELGYAFTREDNGDPIVAFRDNIDFSSVLSGIYNFTPRLNITLRARHYWNKINYKEFFDVANNGKLIDRTFINNQDQNVNFFNTDVFLTWDFRLGSRIILAYKNWLGNNEQVAIPTDRKNTYIHNLSQQFNLPHGIEFSVRFIYFLDYNQFRKKK